MKKTLLFSALCMVLSLLLLWQAQSIESIWQEPMGPAVFPTVLSVLLLVASGGSLLQDFLEIRRNKACSPKIEQSGAECGLQRFKPNATMCLMAISFLYVLGLTYVGFYTSTFAYIMAAVGLLSYFSEKEKWKRVLLRVGLPLSVCIIGVLIFFEHYLHIYLPDSGVLW